MFRRNIRFSIIPSTNSLLFAMRLISTVVDFTKNGQWDKDLVLKVFHIDIMNRILDIHVLLIYTRIYSVGSLVGILIAKNAYKFLVNVGNSTNDCWEGDIIIRSHSKDESFLLKTSTIKVTNNGLVLEIF